ncbi:MAG TPA: DegT/DnrJ/EryC1/StrS family aminotransferase [Phycisphaerae bacterium]|nr:DegT/DnrJ/EryC1/StrS family aminotransferase [Phycisphaerae bacterium]
MEVPLLDLKAQYATIRNEMMAAIEAVMDSQHFVMGPWVRQLEQEIAAYCDCKAAVGVSSGTDALLCALMAMGIGDGTPACRVGRNCPGCDEVITTPYTFFSTAGAIWRVGARPVFVDIEPDTLNIDPARIEAAVTEHTKAIVPVHLYGQCAEMDPILEVAGKHGIHVIEDAAQAIGATYRGRKAGSMGTVGCLSFYPSKNLAGLGDGGMITTQDAELADRMAQCRNHGAEPKYYHKWVGGNFRLDSIQAAGLLVKLEHLDAWSAKRRQNAARYNELFAGFEPVTTPIVRQHNVSIFNQYVIRVPRRDELRDFLKGQGIGTEIYYPLSLHEQECFADLGYAKGDFPHSEKAAAESLALPIYPELTDEQIAYVAGKVKQFLS